MRFLVWAAALSVGAASFAQDIDFGDDSGRLALNGTCADRRFQGAGMAPTLTWMDTMGDATDCMIAYENGEISLWNFADAIAATQCSEIDFGDDSGDYPEDGECDDPRFEGMATDNILFEAFVRRDATDCRRACDMGVLGLRNYAE